MKTREHITILQAKLRMAEAKIVALEEIVQVLTDQSSRLLEALFALPLPTLARELRKKGFSEPLPF